MGVSLEVVPRNAHDLHIGHGLILKEFPHIDRMTIPDLPQLKITSLEAAAMLQGLHSPFPLLPHIRARDYTQSSLPALFNSLRQYDLQEVLVVTGDGKPGYTEEEGVTCVALIRALKEELPELKVYAALDPYRGPVQKEIQYVQEKAAAGAHGFFTQPFFDLRYLEIFADLMASYELHWGITPVLTEKFVRYWQNRQVFFPSDFSPTYAWNKQFARDVLELIPQLQAHVYLMPITVDLKSYLEDLLRPALQIK